MIVANLDLTAMKESGKIVKNEKNGRSYINVVIDERRNPDNYGNDHTVYVSQTKEERDAKAEKKYCGSGKKFVFNNQQSQQQAQQQNQVPPAEEDGDDLPW